MLAVWPFRLSGTTSRRTYATLLGVYFLAVIGLFVAEARGIALNSRIVLPLLLVGNAILAAATARRLHAAGRTGLWALLIAVPIVALVVVAVVAFLRPAAQPYTGRSSLRPLGGVLIALVLVVALGRVFVKPYWIPAESMKPSLLVGDFLLVPYGGAQGLRPGDITVLRHPGNGREFIKRVIGLPGDTVQIRNGILFLNGAEVPQQPDGTFEEVFAPQGPMGSRPACQNGPVGEGAPCQKSRAIETLPNGARYPVLNIRDDGVGDSTDVFTVPEGQYFFLGDNRDNSADSRFSVVAGGMGMIPAENIIGHGGWILFSSAGSSLWDVAAWRPGRYFLSLDPGAAP